MNAIGVVCPKKILMQKKGSVVAAPGEISRGPFVQTLYAGLEITDYVIILQSDYLSLYGNAIKSINSIDHTSQNKYSNYRSYITAIKTKPFLLLAGISGTAKAVLSVNWPVRVGTKIPLNIKLRNLRILR